MNNFSIAIHGGAGTILKSEMSPEKEAAYQLALSEAINAGYTLLSQGKSAIDAVEHAVKLLEDCPLFNAGKGSVYTAEGKHEMDASIMDGKTLNAGAVAMVRLVKNPVELARKVMDKSGHVFLVSEGAERFARVEGVEFCAEEYFHDQYRLEQWQAMRGSDETQLDHVSTKDRKFGTVGSVALDQFGNIAAATSTGGMTNKRFGRVGDTPMIGAGTYANNETCAISCTGSGEFFIRAVVAHQVSALIEHKGMSLQNACDEVIQQRLMKIGGDGGLIATNSKGEIAFSFNTEGMYRAMKKSDGTELISIYKD